MTDLERFLDENGCFATKHSGESLGAHLMGTYRLLKSVNAPEYLCLAGGLHSIYGTNAFKKRTFSERDQIAARFGAEAERLAWIFGRLRRPLALEWASDAGEALPDRESGEMIDLSPQDLRDLRLLEAANLLEQGADLGRYPNICAVLSERLAETAAE